MQRFFFLFVAVALVFKALPFSESAENSLGFDRDHRKTQIVGGQEKTTSIELPDVKLSIESLALELNATEAVCSQLFVEEIDIAWDIHDSNASESFLQLHFLQFHTNCTFNYSYVNSFASGTGIATTVTRDNSFNVTFDLNSTAQTSCQADLRMEDIIFLTEEPFGPVFKVVLTTGDTADSVQAGFGGSMCALLDTLTTLEDLFLGGLSLRDQFLSFVATDDPTAAVASNTTEWVDFTDAGGLLPLAAEFFNASGELMVQSFMGSINTLVSSADTVSADATTNNTESPLMIQPGVIQNLTNVRALGPQVLLVDMVVVNSSIFVDNETTLEVPLLQATFSIFVAMDAKTAGQATLVSLVDDVMPAVQEWRIVDSRVDVLHIVSPEADILAVLQDMLGGTSEIMATNSSIIATNSTNSNSTEISDGTVRRLRSIGL